MVGEMLFNFPWYLAIIPFFLFGLFLRVIYRRLVLNRPTLVSVALYATLMTWSAQFLLSSLGKSIFEMAIWIVPLLLVGTLAKVQGVPATASAETSAPADAKIPGWGNHRI